jgi:hypothetical protein
MVDESQITNMQSKCLHQTRRKTSRQEAEAWTITTHLCAGTQALTTQIAKNINHKKDL